jgi:polysaccharide pyruvyl transferase WcaK-like protein
MTESTESRRHRFARRSSLRTVLLTLRDGRPFRDYATTRPRVHVVGHLGDRNFGDELMATGLQLLAEREGMEVVQWTTRQLPAFLAAMSGPENEPQRLVIAAGSSFHDLYPASRMARQTVAKVLYLGFGAVARARQLPVVFTGSIGPSWRRASVATDRALVAVSDELLLRDRASVGYVAMLGRRSAVALSPDLALPALECLTHQPRPPVVPHSVLICPVSDRMQAGTSHPPARPTVDALLAEGYRKLTILSSHSPEARDTDDDAVSAIVNAARAQGLDVSVVTWQRGSHDATDVVADLMGSHSLVISARLHPAMTAMSLGRPTLVAPYHPKLVDVLCEQFGDLLQVSPRASALEIRALVRAAAPPTRGIGDVASWDEEMTRRLLG